MPPSAAMARQSRARRGTRLWDGAGAVVAGEEGAVAVGRRGGVVVGNRYEDYEAWRAVAGVGAAIAIGTMLARPPSGAVTMMVGGSSYYYANNTYYTRVMTGGAIALSGGGATRGRYHSNASRAGAPPRAWVP